jgi:hypothetical protein
MEGSILALQWSVGSGQWSSTPLAIHNLAPFAWPPTIKNRRRKANGKHEASAMGSRQLFTAHWPLFTVHFPLTTISSYPFYKPAV